MDIIIKILVSIILAYLIFFQCVIAVSCAKDGFIETFKKIKNFNKE